LIETVCKSKIKKTTAKYLADIQYITNFLTHSFYVRIYTLK